MADEKKFSWSWLHTVIVCIVGAVGLWGTIEQRVGQKALDRERADSAYVWAQRFTGYEWILAREKRQIQAEQYGPRESAADPAGTPPQSVHSHHR